MHLTYSQYNLVYNAISLVIASMLAATVFLFLSRSQVAHGYKTAVTVSGIVTMLALYHYFRIFNSWDQAYSVINETVTSTGRPFNEAYRYVDWLLTVPLLVTELILVMKLPSKEETNKCFRLATFAVFMIVLGYPGENATSTGPRLLWWGLSMIFFLLIQYELFFGLKAAISQQPENARGMVSAARYITVVTWLFYPIVYLFPLFGASSSNAYVGVQVGYSIADILAKAGFGLFIYVIALRKSQDEAEMPKHKQDVVGL